MLPINRLRQCPFPKAATLAVGLFAVSLPWTAWAVPVPPEARSSESAMAKELLLPAGGPAVYLVGTQGQLEALDRDTGKVLWSTESASQPLFVANGRLYAVSPQSRLVVRNVPQIETASVLLRVFEADGGKELATLEPCSFPRIDWSKIGSGVGSDKTALRIVRVVQSGDRVDLEWTARARMIPRGPDGRHPPTETLEGKIHLDLKKEALESEKEFRVRPLELDREMGWQAFETLPEARRNLVPKDHENFRFLVVGDRLCAVESVPNAKEGAAASFRLRSWSLTAGTEADAVGLSTPGQEQARIEPTLDRTHLYVASDPKPKICRLTDGQIWPVGPELADSEGLLVQGKRVYRLGATGKDGGQSVRPDGTIPRCVRCYDLESGKILWERALAPTVLPPLVP